MMWKKGRCHCGQVQFEVRSEFKQVYECNCSICTMKGFLHLIVEKNDFKLLSHPSNLKNYQFGTQTAHHLFCQNCGISSYYVPRSHPNGFSVNARCIENLDTETLEKISFDGKNWEQAKKEM